MTDSLGSGGRLALTYSASEIREEFEPDYQVTAKLAAAAFDLPEQAFQPDRLRWLYTRAFTDGTTIFGLFKGDKKVGQIALVHQRVSIAGEVAGAVALFDLFITKEYRSREAIGALYGRVEQFCRESGIRFIIGVPNEAGARVNIRYLKLAQVRRLDVRAGVALPVRSRRVATSSYISDLDQASAIAQFDEYMPARGVGLDWSGARLWERLSGDFSPYAVHAVQDLLLISSLRRTRGIRHTLICGFFSRSDRGSIARRSVLALVSAACRLHRQPIYVYAGCHDGLPLPGVPLPDALRPSPWIVQLRDFAPQGTPSIDLNRFEILDFDFA